MISKKDLKNESMNNEKSMINESEMNPEGPNQSILNISHNISINHSLNQSVASCLICYEKSPDSVLMECGHGGKIINFLNKSIIFFIGLCYECAVDIWKKNGECYLCRKVFLIILFL